jgi:hypothetical protein
MARCRPFDVLGAMFVRSTRSLKRAFAFSATKPSNPARPRCCRTKTRLQHRRMAVMKPEPPQSLAQAVERLLAALPAEARQRLRFMREEDLIDLHLSLGMGIRNAFPIWGNEPLLRSCAIERRPRIVAEMEKALANAWFWQRSAVREFFGRLMQQESVHPDDASGIIIHAAWERLQGTR